MRIDALEAFDIPPKILSIWREKVGAELLPAQTRAVREFGLFGDGHLIVFAPTSSGKTFIGEMAAVRAAIQRLKVFYLVPQRALADEKGEELREHYAGCDIKVVVSSRDHREHDRAIEEGEFHIAVVVVEKLEALLARSPDLLNSVGLVVIDEMQLITDPKRGPTLELLLTKILLAPSRPRIVGLSAVLGNAELLAKWLKAKLLEDKSRPVELRKGVLFQGEYTYYEHNTGARGTETFPASTSKDREGIVIDTVEMLLRRGEQALAFVPDRRSAVEYARKLAARLGGPAAINALAQLGDHEDSLGRDALREVLGASIAFHSSDLSREHRRIVESNFKSGAIRAIFSTPTLAMGMNFPVKNVVLHGKCWTWLETYDKWKLQDVTKSDYENTSGRAGRFGFTPDFGRSLLVALSNFDVEGLLKQYVDAPFEEVAPTLAAKPLEDHVINLVASKLARTSVQVQELLRASLTGFAIWSKTLSADELATKVDRAIAICLHGELLEKKEDGALSATHLGRVCAQQGIAVRTAIALAQWARESGSAPISALEVLTVVSSTFDGAGIYVSIGEGERTWGRFRAELLRRAAHLGLEKRAVFEQIMLDQRSVDRDRARALRSTLILNDWIGEVRTKAVESGHQVWGGAIEHLGEDYAWLVEALASVAAAMQVSVEQVAAIETVARRLTFGVREDALPIMRLRVRGIGRTIARRLVDAGLGTIAALKAADREVVREIVNHAGAFAALVEKLDGAAPKAEPQLARPVVLYGDHTQPLLKVAEGSGLRTEREVVAPPAESGPMLLIDLVGRRVVYRGHEIRTKPPNNPSPQLFFALAALALKPGATLTMADLSAKAARLGATPRLATTPAARDLRYRIKCVLAKALDGHVVESEIEMIVQSVPGRGLRLGITGEALVVGAPTKTAKAKPRSGAGGGGKSRIPRAG